MLKNLYCIVGASGSGKTTIANELEKRGLTQIQSYTTRPKRVYNEMGHIFISPKEFNKLNNICAYDRYNGYDYCATAEQIENNDIYVVNPAGVKQLHRNYRGDKTIYTIYIDCNILDRFNRMILRGNSYNEALKRIINDASEFSNYKKQCDLAIENNDSNDLTNVVDMIYGFIKEKEYSYDT